MNKKVSVSTLLLVMAIMVIGVMGYMLYNMNSHNVSLEKQVEELANKENEEIVEDEEIETEENSFALYQENYQKAYKQMLKNQNEISIYLDDDSEISGVVEIYLDNNNDAYLTFKENSDLYTKYGKEYKVESGVANIFLCPEGNGGYADAIFLKLDGTASYISGYKLENTITVECEKFENVENVVNVISYFASEDGITGAREYAFIDINGNVIK